MPFRRKGGFRRRGGNRGLVWVPAAADGFGTITPGSSSVATLVSLTDATSDRTLRRMRGRFQVRVSDPGSGTPPAFVSAWGAVGVIKIPDVVTSQVPTPWTNAGDDWIWHSYFALSPFAMTEVGYANHHVLDLEIDSKAMRKMDDDDDLIIVVENQSASASIDFTYGIRHLFSISR